MNDVVIRAEGLGKKYVIGHQSAERERYTALRDVIGRSVKALGRSAVDVIRGRQIVAGDEIEEFWALKDVSFEIKRGEVVGIIGRNGAGKSTLLKILSRITEPTTGRVEIKGRVASLLEVGTGFHPELTGRENIYLNGAILGMNRAEIRKKFDEIVAFAEVEKFLDTPVKRYSSGMYVRLAFAVAAHLEPEILVVDEVLAVGDAAFQKKCLGKMSEVAGGGRTVLFVSHNLGAMTSLCSQALILSSGQIDFKGDADEAIYRYNNMATASQNNSRFRSRNIELFNLRLLRNGKPETAFQKSDEIAVFLEVIDRELDPRLHIGYALYKAADTAIWWSFFGDAAGKLGLPEIHCVLHTIIPKEILNDGTYMLEIIAAIDGVGWILPPMQNAMSASFKVEGGAIGSVHLSSTSRPGLLQPVIAWTVTPCI